MLETIDSDVTMLAADIFNKLVNQIQNSCLNYQLMLTPYSASISLKKTFVKDKTGRTILPTDLKDTLCDFPKKSDNHYSKLQQELDSSESKQHELSRELEAAYAMIDVLKKEHLDFIDIIKNRKIVPKLR